MPFTAPDGSTNTYAYDTLGRLATLTNSLTGQFGFSYDTLSRRTALNRPNGVNTSYSYDSLSRLLNVLHQAGTVTLDGAGYTYDDAGNRTAKTNYLNNITEQYTYDPLYQLTQVTQGTTTTESYSYDAVGNRLSSLGMSPYAYNSSNELTSTPAATFTYDSNGNTLTKADSSGTTTYNWDFENRLSSVVLSASGGTVAFQYDPLGRRIQKSSSAATTNYLYDGSNSVAEVNSTGALIATYAQTGSIDDPLAQLRSGTAGYYEQDSLGSVTSISGTAGILLNSDTYDSFGNRTASSGSLGNPFQYTGRDYDPETGLEYYRARYYDSTPGRFLSEDPIRFHSGGVNFYAYADGDPVSYNDPDGLRVEVCCRPLHGIAGKEPFGRNHCYVLITSDDDQRRFHTYGLHREDEKGVKFPEGARPRTDDGTDIGGTCAVVPDATPCKERKFIEQAMSDTNCPSCKDGYWPFSTNSNYWVWNALTNAGMTPPDFTGGRNAPGYGNLPPPGHNEGHVVK